MPDLEGDLAVFQPISVLQLLNLAEATGRLELAGESNSAHVYFEGGNVTYAGIVKRPVKLGEYLVREGLVDEKVVAKMLKKKTRGQKRIGTLLVEAGYLDETQLRKAVIEQIKEVVYEIVGWQEGTFSFQRDATPASQEIRIDIPLDHLMLEGLKRLDEERENSV